MDLQKPVIEIKIQKLTGGYKVIGNFTYSVEFNIPIYDTKFNSLESLSIDHLKMIDNRVIELLKRILFENLIQSKIRHIVENLTFFVKIRNNCYKCKNSLLTHDHKIIISESELIKELEMLLNIYLREYIDSVVIKRIEMREFNDL
ncbi:MAG: hypothetical protein KatS3mg002_0403 [Candidatus Woesearchaeota archaeon]|nr:MAG: hypothetical protein KatS3mg002_0403 [Candidatus Woesearchaeota archaeon]